jgi:nucleoside-diphosphate-sugar epimerase
VTFENIAVTGGTGLLGSHVMRRLSGRASLTAVDIRPPHEADRNLGTYVEASITDYEAMRRAFDGKDAVIHLAAIPNPREAAAGVTFNTNVQGAWTVLQAAEDAGVRRVVVASSDSVFGLSFNPPDWPPQFLPVDETHPSRPTEFYSLSKKVTETIAESFAARKQLQVLAIRPSHIVFPRGYPEIQKRGADVQNYHFWAWVAPEDVAQAFDRAVHMPSYRGYDMFAIAAADGMNSRPTLEMAEERWGKLPIVRRPEIYESNLTASVIDISKARRMLGYDPAIDRAALLAKARA